MRQDPSEEPARPSSKRKPPWLRVLCAFLSLLATAYSSPHPSPPQEQIPPAAASTDTTPQPLILADGAEVSLRLAELLDSAQAKPGDALRLVAAADVRANGLIVVARGAPAEGRIVDIRPARRLGRSAEMSIDFEWVESVTGAKIPLRTVHRAKGLSALAVHEQRLEKLYQPASPDDKVEEAIRVIVVTAAMPFVIVFGKGKDLVLQPGTRVFAYVEGDVRLDAGMVQAAQLRFPRAGGDAQVTFVRPQDGQVARPWLYCQRLKMAHLGARRYLQLKLRPGKYSCYAYKSKPMEFDFEAGEQYFIRIRYRMSLSASRVWEMTLLDTAEGEEEVTLAEPLPSKDMKPFGELAPSP